MCCPMHLSGLTLKCDAPEFSITTPDTPTHTHTHPYLVMQSSWGFTYTVFCSGRWGLSPPSSRVVPILPNKKGAVLQEREESFCPERSDGERLANTAVTSYVLSKQGLGMVWVRVVLWGPRCGTMQRTWHICPYYGPGIKYIRLSHTMGTGHVLVRPCAKNELGYCPLI